ncbi:MAG TPA: methyl-accepting chemotaxis protein [bacterium]|nr:methyl-accepting chemotaxis protein [bacterium]
MKTIRGKFLALVVPIIVLTIGLMTYVSYSLASSKMLDKHNEDNERLLKKTMDDYLNWFKEREMEVEIFASTGVFISASQGERLDEVAPRLKIYGTKAAYYENIFLADTNGKIIADSIGGQSTGVNLAQSNDFGSNISNSLAGKVYLSKFNKSFSSGKVIALITAPVMSKGVVVGIMGASVDNEYLTKEFFNFKIGNTGYFFMVSTEGPFLSHPKTEMILNKSIKEYDFGAPMLQQANGSMTYTFTGIKKIASFTTNNDRGWLMAVTQDRPEIVAPINSIAMSLLLVGSIALIVLIVAMVLIITRSISNPINQTADMLRDISEGEGDLTVQLDVTSDDEIGKLSEYFNQFVKKLRNSIQQVAQNSFTLNDTVGSLSDVASQLASYSEQTTNQAAVVASSAEEISVNVNVVTGATEKMSAQANTIASASEQISSGINTVATAVEEMNAALMEVSKNTNRASQITNDAVDSAQSAQKLIGVLEAAANEIGKVVELINDIADQTNLLALNATIEAASAGEAGKGFAVVANEVKELAKQTASATDSISEQIKNMQSHTNEAVDSIRQITQVIGEINDINHLIATSVEEQTSTTNEISRSVANVASGANDSARSIQELHTQINKEVVRGVKEAATGVNEVSRNIQGVNEAAQETAKAAANTDHMSKTIADLSEQLNAVVGQFRT